MWQEETRYISVLYVWIPDVESLLDMLRYDACYPATEADYYKLHRLIYESENGDDHIIKLIRAAKTDRPADTQRWRSFGCLVLTERHPAGDQPTAFELAGLVKVAVGTLPS